MTNQFQRCVALTVVLTGGLSLALGAAPNAIAKPAWDTLPLASMKQKPTPLIAQDDTPLAESATLDLPDDAKDSPVLQRWLDEIPNVQDDIRNDPAFRPRLRLNYSVIDDDSGIFVGIDDAFVGETGLTVSADYQATFNGDRELYGADLRYYVLPLGSYVNLAPMVGYRQLNLADEDFSGLEAGVRAVLALSRGGAADIVVTQSWIAPGTDEEVGLTSLSLGYAVSDRLRISTDIQAQNSTESKDTRFGIGLEWLL